MTENIKKIRPMSTQVLLTKNKYQDELKTKNGVILASKGTVELIQTVVAVGPMVRDVKVGDVVKVNPTRYFVLEHPEDKESLREYFINRNPKLKYEFPTFKLADGDYIMIEANDIEFIVEEFA